MDGGKNSWYGILCSYLNSAYVFFEFKISNFNFKLKLWEACYQVIWFEKIKRKKKKQG